MTSFSSVFIFFLFTFTLIYSQTPVNRESCMDFKNNDTWPTQLVKDLTECNVEAEDDQEVAQLSTLPRTDMASKIQGFLYKVWTRYVTTMKWTNNKISILNCMWKKQNLFDLETKLVKWDQVILITDQLKITEVRKSLLKDALNECKQNSNDNLPAKQIDIFKCFFKHAKTKEACPQTIRRPWSKNEKQIDNASESSV